MVRPIAIRGVIDSGGGVLRLEPSLGAALVHASGRRLRLHPDDLRRVRRAPRRHQRAVVFLHDERRQRTGDARRMRA